MRLSINYGTIAGLLAAGVLAAAPSAAAGVDPYAASTKTCEAVINDDVKREYPKAKNIAWNMSSAAQEEVSKREVRLQGSGSYKGDSGRGRSYSFDCTYNTSDDRVVAASWTSSFDGKRHVVVAAPRAEGPTPEEVAKACRGPVERLVSKEFPSSVGQLELIEDTLELAKRQGALRLTGEGRFRGGGGTWRRFTFTCDYDADDKKVTDATWRHLGPEEAD